MKDTIYRSDNISVKPFEFNQKVVDVFPDMITRSVPGYPLTISMIGVMADEFVQADSSIYDLGCSLGAVSLMIQKSINNKACNIIAVDNSEAMIASCRKNIPNNKSNINIEFNRSDIQQIDIINASVVVMNFTLQFIPIEQRLNLIKKIYDGLLSGGVFILSEKVVFDTDTENNMVERLHHHMKFLNGYEKLEIASKRQALEDVLIPETTSTHQTRLNDAGFEKSLVWLKCFNFVSMLAIK